MRSPGGWVALSISLGLFGCPSPYALAEREDTPQGYRRFLELHPGDPNEDAAKARLAELELQRASARHTVLAYKAFLEEFPSSAQAPAARSLLEEIRFDQARQEGTIEAFLQFISDHPDGRHRSEAESKLAALELEAIGRLDDQARLTRLAADGDPATKEKAAARLEQIAFEQALAQGPKAMARYLSDRPEGMHRQEIKARLFEIKLDGLLFSGALAEAQAEREKSPLSAAIPQLDSRFERALQDQQLRGLKNPWAQSALPENYVRSLPDLVRSLRAPDPIDRWQAAEELAEHLDVRAIDPLLEAIGRSRNLLVRARAFEALSAIVTGLPKWVAEEKLVSREPAQASLTGPIGTAVLADLAGRLPEAMTEYQRAGEQGGGGDPFVLLRIAELRAKVAKPFSSAVAARQLGLWAERVAQETDASASEAAVALASARQLCAAGYASARAVALIEQARGAGGSEFPEDLPEFSRQAEEIRRHVLAKLADAELTLRTQDPHAITCQDQSARERIEAGRRERMTAVRALSRRPAKSSAALLRLVRETDPSSQVRATAEEVLAGILHRKAGVTW